MTVGMPTRGEPPPAKRRYQGLLRLTAKLCPHALFHIEGVRNYTYVHARNGRQLCRSPRPSRYWAWAS